MQLACINLPAFPLQLLLKRHPEFRAHPTVVVDHDKPTGKILWTNEAARRMHVLPGMRYASALSLTNELRAGVVSRLEVQEHIKEIHKGVLNFSPEVECALQEGSKKQGSWENIFEKEPGVFWVNTSGLSMLFPDKCAWVRGVRDHILEKGFFSTVVAGFTRFGTYAQAKSRPGYGVFRNVDNELQSTRGVALERLGISPKDRDFLAKLKIHTIGDLCALPAGALRRRFSDDVHRLYRMATGELNAPLRSTKIEAPIECKVSFDFAITHNNPLLFLIKRHLHVLLTELANVNQALISLEMVFETDLAFSDEKFLYEKVCPASPSLDETQILGLVRLKLESQKRAPIISMKLVAKGVRASLEQTRLFHELSQSKGRFKTRDLKAGERALARVSAQFGDDSVLRSVVNDGHLPETKMRFEPLKKMCLPQVSKRENTRLVHAVRRIFSRAHDVGAPRGMYVAGPFWVSGGWWSCEVRRAYHYIDDESGTLDWVYFDERKGCWRRQGIV